MATGPTTRISDVVVPEIFNPYIQLMTEKKSAIIQSGAAVRSSEVDTLLNGAGLTFQIPAFNDLDDDADVVGTDDSDDSHVAGQDKNIKAKKITTVKQVAVRLNRNQAWGSSALTAQLAGADPMTAIGDRVGDYWARRLQDVFLATMKGVFADNAAAPTGTEHVLNDMTHDISGDSNTAASSTTRFSLAAFIDASVTMGDSMGRLAMILVHSVVYARLQKNNEIDFVEDSDSKVRIPTYLGKRVIIDDSMPVTSGVYESWLFGTGAVQLGMGNVPMATETEREPAAGGGTGEDILYSRQLWCVHPKGYKYAGTAPNGGPSNAATANNLANAGSWQRVFPERKQIPIARLITREH